MAERLEELEEIFEQIGVNPTEVSKDVRKQFWKLVREIKRDPEPDLSEVRKATEIRNILFDLDRGRVYSIGPFLGTQTIFGFVAFLGFLYGLSTHVDWFLIWTWTFTEIIAVVIRFFGLFLVVALFYPYGRIIAGKAFGIRMEAMCFDEYREPTLKIDYESFLLAKPSKRKWFFFFSGSWTFITAIVGGLIGFYIDADILGILFGGFLAIFYIYVISSGTTSHGRGEMAHYNREKKIERVWKKRISHT